MLARRLLGVRNAGAGGHHVHTARVQYRCTAQAVVVHDLTFVKPRDGLQADVRVRRDVHRLALTECEWPEAVEEAPWTDEAPVSDPGERDRQRAQVHFAIRIRLELGLADAEAMRSAADTTSERFNMIPGGVAYGVNADFFPLGMVSMIEMIATPTISRLKPSAMIAAWRTARLSCRP